MRLTAGLVAPRSHPVPCRLIQATPRFEPPKGSALGEAVQKPCSSSPPDRPCPTASRFLLPRSTPRTSLPCSASRDGLSTDRAVRRPGVSAAPARPAHPATHTAPPGTTLPCLPLLPERALLPRAVAPMLRFCGSRHHPAKRLCFAFLWLPERTQTTAPPCYHGLGAPSSFPPSALTGRGLNCHP